MKKRKSFRARRFFSLGVLFASAVLYPFGSSPALFLGFGSTAPDGAVSRLVLRSALWSLSAFRSPWALRFLLYRNIVT